MSTQVIYIYIYTHIYQQWSYALNSHTEVENVWRNTCMVGHRAFCWYPDIFCWHVYHERTMEVDLFTISKGSAHHRSSLGQDAFQLYEDFFNGTLFQGLLGDRYHQRWILDSFKVIFLRIVCTMVSHHQATTIWDNIFYFFRAAYDANLRHISCEHAQWKLQAACSTLFFYRTVLQEHCETKHILFWYKIPPHA